MAVKFPYRLHNPLTLISQRFFLFLLREESGGATWMTHPHAFLKKGGELMIDLKPYFAGYNKNPLFTIISDGGIKCEPKGDGSYLIHAPRKDGCYTVRVNVIDDDRVSSLTRDFYFVVTSRI